MRRTACGCVTAKKTEGGEVDCRLKREDKEKNTSEE